METILLCIGLLCTLITLVNLFVVMHMHRPLYPLNSGSYAEAFCDHYLVREPGVVRRSISEETLQKQPLFLRLAIKREMVKRGYRKLNDGCWVNDSPHWIDCPHRTGGNCNCWRKQFGYEHLDSPECHHHVI